MILWHTLLWISVILKRRMLNTSLHFNWEITTWAPRRGDLQLPAWSSWGRWQPPCHRWGGGHKSAPRTSSDGSQLCRSPPPACLWWRAFPIWKTGASLWWACRTSNRKLLRCCSLIINLVTLNWKNIYKKINSII